MAYRSIRGQKPQGQPVTAKVDDEKVRTHFSNYDSFPTENPDDLNNDQGVNRLIDPDEQEKPMKSENGVRTHFSNYEESPPAVPVKKNPVSAHVGEATDCDTNVSTIPNDVNPATGYLEFDPVETSPKHSDSAPLDNPVVNQTAGKPAGEGPVPPVVANLPETTDNVPGDPSLETPETLGDGDIGGQGLTPPPVELDQADVWEGDAVPPAPGIAPGDQDELVQQIGVEPGGAFEGEPAEAEAAPGVDENAELVDLLDVDEVPEEDTSELLFANVGTNSMVIRAGRIIATMTSKRAVMAGFEDDYQTAEFQDSTLLECRTLGLRAGLKSMGYRLATVNVAASALVNKRVEAKVAAATKQISASVKDSDASFGQCLAIASVGLTRDMWKDVPNQLRAGLEDNLTRAGLRNAGKVVQAAFAQHGVEYTRSLIQIAQKLAAMPVEARNGLASAMDMLDPQASFEAPDTEESGGRGFVGASVQDDWEDDQDDRTFMDVPSSVTAALSRAGRADQGALLTPKQTRYSVHASAVLNDDAPLDFSYMQGFGPNY